MEFFNVEEGYYTGGKVPHGGSQNDPFEAIRRYQSEEMERRARSESMRQKYWAAAQAQQAPHQAAAENRNREMFAEIIDQLNHIEDDFKKFNFDWDTEGMAACYLFRHLKEHLVKAREKTEFAERCYLQVATSTHT